MFTSGLANISTSDLTNMFTSYLANMFTNASTNMFPSDLDNVFTSASVNIFVEIPELNSTKNKSKRDKLSEHVRLLT